MGILKVELRAEQLYWIELDWAHVLAIKAGTGAAQQEEFSSM